MEGEGGRPRRLAVTKGDAQVGEVARAAGGRRCGAQAERRQKRAKSRQVSERCAAGHAHYRSAPPRSRPRKRRTTESIECSLSGGRAASSSPSLSSPSSSSPHRTRACTLPTTSSRRPRAAQRVPRSRTGGSRSPCGLSCSS